jgi:hypothetical protein
MSSPAPLPPHRQLQHVPIRPDKLVGIAEKSALFVLQVVLGFLGTVGYYAGVLCLMALTMLRSLGPGSDGNSLELIFYGAGGLGIVVIFFLTLYFRWWGVLAEALLAFSMPSLMVGGCLALFSLGFGVW